MLSSELIDKYLNALATKMKLQFGSEAYMQMTIVGGAAIALSYSFRRSTMDIDMYTRYSQQLQFLAVEIAHENDLDEDWLSSNVMATTSCPPSIEKYTYLYKQYQGVLDVYVVDALTLVCMKSVACRPDSHDLFDIENILNSEPDITFYDIMERFIELFQDWSAMKMDAQLYLTKRFNAMPPDMTDLLKEYLKPSVVARADSKQLYFLCSEVYAGFM